MTALARARAALVAALRVVEDDPTPVALAAAQHARAALARIEAR